MKTLTGNEHFTFDGMPVNKLLLDFWAWNQSYLLSDGIRGELAEFIVATALGITDEAPRSSWGDYDLLLDGEFRIEVKSAAYLQAWDVYDGTRLPVRKREGFSKIVFDIKPVRASGYSRSDDVDIRRHSEAYVFCLYACKNAEEANPLVLDGWQFYVLPTARIDALCGEQKRISLGSLLKLDPYFCKFDSLNEAVRKAVYTV